MSLTAERLGLRLYVAGSAENSAQARANLAEICQKYFEDGCDVEIVDVFIDPGRALTDGIMMTPTLIKLSPLPLRRVVGSLSEVGVVLRALGLDALAT